MNLQDLTTDQIDAAVRRALIALYGDAWWTYPVAIKPNADPPVVVYDRASTLYRRTFTLAIAGELAVATLGGEEQEVVAQTIYLDVPAEFGAPQGDEALVEWTGNIFRTGDYGAKGRYDTPHLEGFVSRFPAGGVPIKDSHADTFFGKCLEDHGAKVARVWMGDDGATLQGAFQAPQWAADAAKKRVKSVSIGLTDDRLSLREVSLVLNPHVADAAVFERDLARAIVAAPTFSAFAAAHPDDARLVTRAAEAHDPVPAPAPAKSNPTMNFQEKAKAAFALLTPAQREQVGLTQVEINDAANFAAPTPDPRDEVMLRSAAKAERNSLVALGHPVPEAPFLALFSLAAKKDGGGGVTFSDGEITTGDAVKALRTMAEAIPKKALGREALPAAEFKTDDEKKANDSFTEAAKAAAKVK